jgi:hypothetical protein
MTTWEDVFFLLALWTFSFLTRREWTEGKLYRERVNDALLVVWAMLIGYLILKMFNIVPNT